MVQELRLPVDRRKKAIEYFAYSEDWIKRHQDCKTCDKNEWKAVATYLSKMIQVYVRGEDVFTNDAKGILKENQP